MISVSSSSTLLKLSNGNKLLNKGLLLKHVYFLSTFPLLICSGDDEELANEAEGDGDHRSEAGTYTVDDPQAKEARRKIDQVFGVHGASAHAEDPHVFNDYQNRTRTFSKATKHANVPVTRVSTLESAEVGPLFITSNY